MLSKRLAQIFLYEIAVIKDNATLDATMKDMILLRNPFAKPFSLLLDAIDTSTPKGEFVIYIVEDDDAKLLDGDLPKAYNWLISRRRM